MPRKRDPKRDEAWELYKKHNGDITNRRIANILEVDEKKVAVWKQRDKWNVVQQTKKNVVQQKKRKPGGQPGNKHALGNPGNKNPNPETRFAKRNTAALKHGLFAKHLPPETMELVEQLQQEDQTAKLKRSIAIQEAAIIRAQGIMHVESKDELIKHLRKVKNGDTFEEKEWEFQYAWDRQGNFLNSLSRAMSTLMGMYRTLAELEGDNQDDVKERIGFFMDALNGTAEEVWDNEEVEDDE
ncbi:uncharacterized protein YjcR [Evansella vedderi]|uniref:Uncharacterized protein YjcR n=1 Tax=Evansella vedderi TaxID=38282 RepID=A0ABT9ZUJ8_9BACI|nr:phage terminase small subunit [Evansella vedderi]MDQ0254917.1 uncharacterized protein YjcR [Evansella vedderi]